ncbi:hypothetical protein [Hyphomicrobium sp. NDB2Meth4]|uniref:hypothetical protein n=1 Tax=Hyphomicrobium sp. NDB2Meth4 TaxID=1892846 RepID=UPI00093197CA|nr:hypothetical protein [Hyphomicrobium sp. NDB2Meth4]
MILHRTSDTPRHTRAAAVAAAAMCSLLAGCAYSGAGPIEVHYQKYKARMPEGDRVFVCSAYGCRTQTPFKFTPADIAEVAKLMAPGTASPAAEREATKKAIAWMGHRADTAVGTAGDRPGDDMAGNGDPGQMDCVDVATNLTSYMLIMERHKLFRHHAVGSMYVKEDIRRGWSGWTHYAGILVENKSKQKFAVDGWLLASGKPPEIVEVERWYIDDNDLLFGGGGGASSMKPVASNAGK